MVPAPLEKPRVKKYVGENGVTVLHQDDPFSRAFCIGVWVKTGSRDERSGEDGLCHFLEHMLFKGTTTRSPFEISQALEKIGGSLDAFTTKEQICVYAQVLRDHADLAVDVLDDMFTRSTFPPDQIELEKQVVLEEIRDVLDAPDDVIHDLFAAEVFSGHPMGKPILGVPETVAAFDRNALLRFARRHTRESNIVISVFGKFDKRLRRMVCDRAFRFGGGEVKHPSKRIGRHRPTRNLHRRKLHHQHICIGGRACSYLDEGRFALTVLTTLLGGGMSSRLFQRIREELGYAYSVFTYSETAKDTGMVGTYLAVKPANTGAAINEIFNELEKIKNGDVGDDELRNTKEHLKGRILLGLETSTAKMMRIARNEIYYGRQVREREIIDRIDRVTLDDVLESASNLLDRDKNTIVSIGPSSAGLGLTHR